MQKRPLDEICMIQWQRCVDEAQQGLAGLPESQLFNISYEQFVTDPVHNLRDLLEFLDLPQPLDLPGTVADVSSSSVGRGRKKLGDEGFTRLEAWRARRCEALAMSGEPGLSRTQSVVKRSFDIVVASAGIVVTSPVMVVSWLLASLDTRAGGLFRQVRVGKDGRPFRICKLRTMRNLDEHRHHRHDKPGPPHHAFGWDPAQAEARRAPPAVQRACRADELRRTTS